MPLPAFRQDGWLPEGHHPASWKEIEAVFGGETGSRRAQVFSNLLRWRDALRAKGMGGRLILNGSFTSQKPEPGDFDCYFVYDEATEALLQQDAEAKTLTDYGYCKTQGGGDVLVFAEASVHKFPQFCRIDGFDLDKATRLPKGVVEVSV